MHLGQSHQQLDPLVCRNGPSSQEHSRTTTWFLCLSVCLSVFSGPWVGLEHLRTPTGFIGGATLWCERRGRRLVLPCPLVCWMFPVSLSTWNSLSCLQPAGPAPIPQMAYLEMKPSALDQSQGPGGATATSFSLSLSYSFFKCYLFFKHSLSLIHFSNAHRVPGNCSRHRGLQQCTKPIKTLPGGIYILEERETAI